MNLTWKSQKNCLWRILIPLICNSRLSSSSNSIFLRDHRLLSGVTTCVWFGGNRFFYQTFLGRKTWILSLSQIQRGKEDVTVIIIEGIQNYVFSNEKSLHDVEASWIKLNYISLFKYLLCLLIFFPILFIQLLWFLHPFHFCGIIMEKGNGPSD